MLRESLFYLRCCPRRFLRCQIGTLKNQIPFGRAGKRNRAVTEAVQTANHANHAKILTGNSFVTTIRASEQHNLGHPSCGGLGKPIGHIPRLTSASFAFFRLHFISARQVAVKYWGFAEFHPPKIRAYPCSSAVENRTAYCRRWPSTPVPCAQPGNVIALGEKTDPPAQIRRVTVMVIHHGNGAGHIGLGQIRPLLARRQPAPQP